MIKLEGVKNSKEGIWHYVVFYKDGAHLSEMGKRRSKMDMYK